MSVHYFILSEIKEIKQILLDFSPQLKRSTTFEACKHHVIVRLSVILKRFSSVVLREQPLGLKNKEGTTEELVKVKLTD